MAWYPQIDRRRCSGCAVCITACPTSALALVDGRATLVHPAACSYCATCEALCPAGAVALPYLICYVESDDEKEPER